MTLRRARKKAPKRARRSARDWDARTTARVATLELELRRERVARAALEQEVQTSRAYQRAVNEGLRKPTMSRLAWGVDTYLAPLVTLLLCLGVKAVAFAADKPIAALDLLWNNELPIATFLMWSRVYHRLSEMYPTTMSNSIDGRKYFAQSCMGASLLILFFFLVEKEGLGALSGATHFLAVVQLAMFFAGAVTAWSQDTDDRLAWAKALNIPFKEVGLSPEHFTGASPEAGPGAPPRDSAPEPAPVL